jgi:hypothetical protein
MSKILREILELLADDIVSHGLIAQSINQFNAEGQEPQLQLDDVLKELLSSGIVEIGMAKKVATDYVEFVAWKGTVVERVLRAKDSVNATTDLDREFAYWVCLQENVDRFEDQKTSNMGPGG